MPELPEVEHVVRTLRQLLCGDEILDVRVQRAPLIRPMTVAAFRAGVRGRRVEDVRRRAKFILIDLAGGRTILAHLRMTGGFVFAEPAVEPPENSRVVFYLKSGYKLGFTDTRNLGTMKLVRAKELGRLKELQPLGIEPLEPEFTPERLSELLGGSRRSIKEFLLDQTKIAGVGNIYAAEALHRAGISPRRRAATVAKSRERRAALHQSIVETLREAVEIQQTGIPLHLDLLGENIPNGYGPRTEEVFRVYDREGQPCDTCGAPIRRIKQGGRSTYFCARCQR